MQVYNAVAYPWLGVIGGLAAFVENSIVEFLRLCVIFFPPLAYAAHVVGRSGADTVVGILPCVASMSGGSFHIALPYQKSL